MLRVSMQQTSPTTYSSSVTPSRVSSEVFLPSLPCLQGRHSKRFPFLGTRSGQTNLGVPTERNEPRRGGFPSRGLPAPSLHIHFIKRFSSSSSGICRYFQYTGHRARIGFFFSRSSLSGQTLFLFYPALLGLTQTLPERAGHPATTQEQSHVPFWALFFSRHWHFSQVQSKWLLISNINSSLFISKNCF